MCHEFIVIDLLFFARVLAMKRKFTGFLLGCCFLTAIAQQVAAEDSPVTQESRAFRVQAYQQFRQDRNRYNALREIDSQLSKQWQEAGKPATREAEVLAWYREALLASTTPTPPDFTAMIAERKLELEQKRTDRTVSTKIIAPAATSTYEPENAATENATLQTLEPAAITEVGDSTVTGSLTRAFVKAMTE
jgi:hypothetical protein